MSDLEDFYRFPDGALKSASLNRAVAERAGVRPEVVDNVRNALADVIAIEIANGYGIRVPRIGKFSPYVKSFFDSEGRYRTLVKCQFKPSGELRRLMTEWLERNMALEDAVRHVENQPYQGLTEDDYARRDAARKVTLR